MSTSRKSDVQSPIPRRLLGSVLGGSQSLENSLSQNDDEAEKQERGRITLMEVELSVSPRNSPRPTDSFSNSFSSLRNLNSVQLAEHFRNCMKLSNENKINTKNAFQLQLIDYMAMILKRKESELDNFQVASCTLDASAKIYAYRVDCVHNEAVKMAGSLIRSYKRGQGNYRSDYEEREKVGEGGTADKPVVKRRCRATVERNTKKLDSQEAKSDFKIDHFFKRMATRFNENQSGGSQFLANLKILDETQEIILSSDRTCWREIEAGEERPNEVVEIPIPNFEAINMAEICPSFSSFTFTGWFPDDCKITTESGFEPFCQDQILGRDAEHAFDINAVPEPIETSDVEDCMDVNSGPDENTMGTVEVVRFAENPRDRLSLELSDLRNVLSLNIQEYSYFKKGMGWAGPSYWKVKPLLKSKQARACGKRKPRTVVTLTYGESASLDDFSNQTDKPICLTNLTIEKWSDLKVTLPEDLHVHISCLLKGLVQRKKAIPSGKTDAIYLEEVDPYNFDNSNDKDDYCTNIKGNDYRDTSNLTRKSQEIPLQNVVLSQEESGYDLVKAPSMVPNVFIPYAKRAKRVDMKRLKKAIFHILTHENKMETTEPDPKETECKKVTGTIVFSKVLHELPKKLPPKDTQNLSFGLVFSALLHLANDKTLLIEGTPDLSDMIVSQDKKLC